jgi:hypothetical protein
MHRNVVQRRFGGAFFGVRPATSSVTFFFMTRARPRIDDADQDNPETIRRDGESSFAQAFGAEREIRRSRGSGR